MPQPPRRGFSLRIFLPDGTPDGVKLVEKSNWTGRALVCPRARFRDARGRDDFGRTGVYVLVGPADDGGLPTVYVGEGDPAGPRLDRHQADKDFWTWFALFTSKDGTLNKAHVQHLEARLYRLAADAKRCRLDNAVAPLPPSLSEPDREDAEGFLDDILLVFPVLGLSVFERPPQASAARVRYVLRARGVVAEGYEADDGFVVRAGSQVADEAAPSAQPYLLARRTALLESGVITAAGGGGLAFAEDYLFDSPSTAAGVVLGRSSNGRELWRDEDGRSLKEHQTARTEEVEP